MRNNAGIAVVSTNGVHNNYSALFSLLPIDMLECVETYADLTTLVKEQHQYKVVVIFSWMGKYTNELKQLRSRLPCVIYLQTSPADLAPTQDSKLLVLNCGKINAQGMLDAFKDLSLL